MGKKLKLGFAFLPRKIPEEELYDYLETVVGAFPECKTLVSTVNNKYERLLLENEKPYPTYVERCREASNLVARGYRLLAAARPLELDYLFFNLGMFRYDASTLIEFVKKCLDHRLIMDLAIGEPEVFYRNKATSEELEVLKNPLPRQRLLIDTLINYALSKTAHGLPPSAYINGTPFMNMNAALFGVRAHKNVLNFLLSIYKYHESSLLCSQIAWHMMRGGDYQIKCLTIKKINLSQLGFDLEKAVDELHIILEMIEKVGQPINPNQLIDDFFALRAPFTSWLEENDRVWIENNVKPRLQELRKI